MLALSDSQLRAMWAAAGGLPIEKHSIFLARFVALLQLRGSHFTTADLDDAVHLALKGVIQKSRSLMASRRPDLSIIRLARDGALAFARFAICAD